MKTATRILVLTAAIATVIPLASPPIAAESVHHSLFGHRTNGWGTSAGSLSKPGPTLNVTLGDNVTLTLEGTDSNTHNWFIDYDDDTNDDGNEPNSPNFGSNSQNWSFVADKNGTWTYRCKNHPNAMYGTITIRTSGSILGGSGWDMTIYGIKVWMIAGGVVGFLLILAIIAKVARRRRR